MFQHTAARRRLDVLRLRWSVHARFNTQPPEGGWAEEFEIPVSHAKFQHTAARRRLGCAARASRPSSAVSTHSRPKAAGPACRRTRPRIQVSTHSRPKAAGDKYAIPMANLGVSTHSRPKAAGFIRRPHHAPKIVSTHSRPKAAGLISKIINIANESFNTQPPEGGWMNG